MQCLGYTYLYSAAAFAAASADSGQRRRRVPRVRCRRAEPRLRSRERSQVPQRKRVGYRLSCSRPLSGATTCAQKCAPAQARCTARRPCAARVSVGRRRGRPPVPQRAPPHERQICVCVVRGPLAMWDHNFTYLVVLALMRCERDEDTRAVIIQACVHAQSGEPMSRRITQSVSTCYVGELMSACRQWCVCEFNNP